MPHCWPQKQQCVFTSFSPGPSDSRCHPPGGWYFRCGPNRLASSSAFGALATRFLLDAQLRAGERLSLTCRTQRLPVPGMTGRRVIEAELRQHAAEIVDMHLRSKPLPASSALGARVLEPCLLVQLDAEL